MYKKLIFLLIMIVNTCVSAQEMQVFAINGRAEMENKGKWTTLVKGQPLNLSDRVRTSQRGSLTILDNERRKIYAVQSEEGGTVEALVATQRARAKSLTREAFAEVKKSLFGKQDDRYATRGGVTYRGNNNDEMLACWLAANIDSRYEILNSQYTVALHAMDPVHHKAVRTVAVGESVELLVVNESDDALYVGIIDVDADSVWSAVSTECELLPPHSAVVLPYPIEFFEPRGTDHLLLIASAEPFNLPRALELYNTGYRDSGVGTFGAAQISISIK